MIPVIWLTLKRNLKRQALFEEHNIQRFPHLRWIRIYGVDAADHGVVRYWSDCTSDGQLGCWLSHWMIWQLILSHGWEQTVVLEDDARLLSDPTVADYKNAFTYLGTNVNGHWNRGTWAYRISLGVASWFVLNLNRPSGNIDHEILKSPVEKLVADPPVAQHADLNNSDTDSPAQKRLRAWRLMEDFQEAETLLRQND